MSRNNTAKNNFISRLLLVLTAVLLLVLLVCILKTCMDCRNQDVPPPSPPSSPSPYVPIPHTGDVQILLKWSNYNDLDISCVSPLGETVDYHPENRRVSSGGELDIDMNAERDSQNPIENIYWPTGRAPKGQYTVYLTCFRIKDGVVDSPYEILVKHGNKTDTYRGTINMEGQTIKICTFVID